MNQLPPIVSTSWLAQQQAQTPALKLVDVRYYLDGRSGHQAFLDGHLPGAIFVDLEHVLSSPGSPQDGRHPMPPPAVFAAGLGAAGIAESDPVVAYDDLGGMVAGRLVWMLRILGVHAALLDGGLAAWSGNRETGPGQPASPVPRRPQPWPSAAMASADEVAAHIEAGGVVADSRAAERYRGEHEPVDPRAGHIPGAINLPFGANLDQDHRFRPAGELAARFEAAGADPATIFYCGSGVSACHNVLAMEAAGLGRPRLFVGSWSAWSSDSQRPIATVEGSC